MRFTLSIGVLGLSLLSLVAAIPVARPASLVVRGEVQEDSGGSSVPPAHGW